MTNHLLLFTIGPVQSFIAQARKTQDLFAGSQLLSVLIQTVIDELNISKEDLILPDNDINDKPNVFLAKVTQAQLDLLKDADNDIRQKIIEKYEILYNQALKKAENLDTSKLNCFPLAQIKDFPQVYWAAEILKNDTDKEYRRTYNEVCKILGAVKNTRTFDPLDELGRKCSLCGERNVLFCQTGSKSKVQLKPNWKNFNDNNPEDQEIKKKIKNYNDSIVEVSGTNIQTGEGLCAVCFTKRFYPNAESFPSTAGIALMDTIEKVKKSDDKLIKNYQNNYFEHQSEKKFEYQLFYKENLSEAYLKKFGYKLKNGISLEEVLKHQTQIENAAKEQGLKLNKYYALIILDADNMGKWLSGAYSSPKDLKEYQKNLSTALGDFASKLNDIIKEEEGTGKLVYAGGDDVLAFVNLNHLIEVVNELNKAFSEKVTATQQIDITYSCGIVVAHYKTPVNEILKRARAAAKLAKTRFEDAGKDAMAITFMSKSGNEKTTVFKNEDFSTFEKIIFALTDPEKVKGNSENKFLPLKISPKFIQTFAMEFAGLETELNYDEFLTYGAMLETELKRLVKRTTKADKDEEKATREMLLNLLTDFLAKQRDNHTCLIDINNFVSFLKIAESLTQEGSFYDNQVNKD